MRRSGPTNVNLNMKKLVYQSNIVYFIPIRSVLKKNLERAVITINSLLTDASIGRDNSIRQGFFRF